MISLPHGRCPACVLCAVAHVIFSLALVAGCPLHCSEVGNQADCAGRFGAVCEWDVDKSWQMPKRRFMQYTPRSKLSMTWTGPHEVVSTANPFVYETRPLGARPNMKPHLAHIV